MQSVKYMLGVTSLFVVLFLSLFLAPDSFINQSVISLHKWSSEKP